MKTLTTWQNATSSTGAAVTTWNYDSQRGWLTEKLYDDNTGPAYTYTDAGRLLTRTWVRTVASAALVTTYAYNNAGDLTLTDYSDSTPDVAITYDRLGRHKTVTDATGERTFTYDSVTLRLESEQLPAYYGDRILTRSYQVGLDLVSTPPSVPGRPDGFSLGTLSDPDSDYDVVYAYDTAGRLSTVTDLNGSHTYGYLANSNLRETLTSPAHTTTTTYEPYRNVVTNVENKIGTTTISNYGYTVNALGQRTARANTGTAFGTTSTDVFTYNAKGEVISSTNATIPAYDRTFAYDDIGNRTSATDNVGTTSYTANTLNAYTAIGAASPTHDADGNQLTTGTGHIYKWDAENRLISVEPALPVTSDKKQVNTYDGQSRRVRKQVYTYTGSTWSLTTDEKFIYDGWNVVAVLNAASSNALLRTYTWGADLSGSMQGAGGVGGLLATSEINSGTISATYHYTYDANGNGNVSEVLNSSGGIAAHYEYDAFGNTVASSGTYAAVNAYRFSTKPLDSVGELYYYGYRYYSPSTGRWLNRDPIGERGGVNLYNFVRNNPTFYYDYLGLDVRIGANASATGEGEDIDDSGRRGRSRHLGGDLQSDWAGRAILARWLNGYGNWVLYNDPDWSRYMMANEVLRAQVDNWVVLEGLRLSRNHGGGDFTERVNLTRHAEFENGEGIIGYQYLHGSNGSVGDFSIRGTIKGNACKLEVDLTYTWNDMIDPNANFTTDQVKSILGETISLGQADDYRIWITWQAKGKNTFADQV